MKKVAMILDVIAAANKINLSNSNGETEEKSLLHYPWAPKNLHFSRSSFGN